MECCTEDIANCDECPYDDYCSIHSQEHNVLKDTLDLINRLQAENEQLKSDISVSRDAYMSMKDRYEYEKEKVENAKQKCIDIAKALKTAKAEAYKECIEKVKEKSKKSEVVCSGALVTTSYLISAKNLDNLLKEMVGENNGD